MIAGRCAALALGFRPGAGDEAAANDVLQAAARRRRRIPRRRPDLRDRPVAAPGRAARAYWAAVFGDRPRKVHELAVVE